MGGDWGQRRSQQTSGGTFELSPKVTGSYSSTYLRKRAPSRWHLWASLPRLRNRKATPAKVGSVSRSIIQNEVKKKALIMWNT